MPSDREIDDVRELSASMKIMIFQLTDTLQHIKRRRFDNYSVIPPIDIHFTKQYVIRCREFLAERDLFENSSKGLVPILQNITKLNEYITMFNRSRDEKERENIHGLLNSSTFVVMDEIIFSQQKIHDAIEKCDEFTPKDAKES